MSIRIVRLGSPRLPREGLRIGTVRHPPRGVPKREYAVQNWFDVWLPELAPSPRTLKLGRSAPGEKQWAAFARKYRSEMKAPERARLLDLLAALSRGSHFSVGCYCAEESRCHRSVLRELLEERSAEIG